MERKALALVLVCMAVINGEQANALFGGFKHCMKTCLIRCEIPPWTASCPAMCIAQCIIHPSETAAHQRTHHLFCTSGCATSTCSNLISEQNYHLDEVEECVDECSQTCVTTYGPPAN